MNKFIKQNFIPVIFAIIGFIGLAYVVFAASITVIQGTDLISDSRAVINANFANLNAEANHDIIVSLANGTNYLTASTTNLTWLFRQGFVSQASSTLVSGFIANASSTVSGLFQAGQSFINGSSTILTLNANGILNNASSTLSILNVNQGLFGTTTSQTSNITTINAYGGFLYGGWYGSSTALGITGNLYGTYASTSVLDATRFFNTNASTTYLSLVSTGNLLIGARANPTLNYAGQLVIDTNTNDNSLQYYASTTNALTVRRQWSATIGSSTPNNYRIPIGSPDAAIVVDSVRAQAVCLTDACAGGATFYITHGTNLDAGSTTLLLGATNIHSVNSGTSTHQTFAEFNDNTLATNEDVYWWRSLASSTIDYINIVINYHYAP